MENAANIILTCGECSEKMYPDKGKFDIKVGQFAKLKFTDKSGIGNEYMWVKVISIDKEKNRYEGVLNNDPIIVRNIKCGDKVRFSKEDIFDVMI